MIKRFKMIRETDRNGVSGTGEVLFGVVMPSGRVIIEWRKPHATLGVYDTMGQFDLIHLRSHPGTGRIEWLDE